MSKTVRTNIYMTIYLLIESYTQLIRRSVRIFHGKRLLGSVKFIADFLG